MRRNLLGVGRPKFRPDLQVLGIELMLVATIFAVRSSAVLEALDALGSLQYGATKFAAQSLVLGLLLVEQLGLQLLTVLLLFERLLQLGLLVEHVLAAGRECGMEWNEGKLNQDILYKKFCVFGLHFLIEQQFTMKALVIGRLQAGIGQLFGHYKIGASRVVGLLMMISIRYGRIGGLQGWHHFERGRLVFGGIRK